MYAQTLGPACSHREIKSYAESDIRIKSMITSMFELLTACSLLSSFWCTLRLSDF